MTRFYFTSLFILSSCLIQSQIFQWAKNFGGITQDFSKSIAVDVTGNICITGYFDGVSDFDSGSGTYTLASNGGLDIYVSKLDASGNFLWAKNIGGTSFEYGEDISVDATGNIFVTGNFNGVVDFDPGIGTYTLASNGSNDIFIFKLDANGNFVWAQGFGSAFADVGKSVALDVNGNVYFTGSFSGTVDFDSGPATNTLNSPGGLDAFICRLDNSGNFIWAKSIGNNCTEEGMSITVDGSGNIYTAGRFECATDFDPGPGTTTITGLGYNDIFVLKLDPNGNYIWAKSIAGSDNDVCYSITTDNSGNVYTTGHFRGTPDFDPGVGTYTLTASGQTDFFISKLDINGDFVWARTIGGSGVDVGHDIIVDASGNSYLTGDFQNTVDFDPGTSVYNLGTTGGCFISKYDANGNFVWAKSMYSTNIGGVSLAFNLAGAKIYIAGNFSSTCDFNPPFGTNLTSSGSLDVFVTEYSSTNSIEKFNSLSDIKIYPNPSSNEIYFEGKTNEIKSIEINDVIGKNVKSYNNVSSIDISSLSNGIYFLHIKTDKGDFNKKFIKN
jgi:hypothetical protein